MDTKFTAAMARTMTDAEIRAFWIARQTAERKFDVLIALDGGVAVDLRKGGVR